MTSLHTDPVPRVNSLSKAAFERDFLAPLRPVVFRRLASAWPALNKWTPQFFIDNFGERKVRVYDASFARPGQHYMSNIEVLPLREFLHAILDTSRDLRMFLYNIAVSCPRCCVTFVIPISRTISPAASCLCFSAAAVRSLRFTTISISVTSSTPRCWDAGVSRCFRKRSPRIYIATR